MAKASVDAGGNVAVGKRGDVIAALRTRDFALLWTGQTVSLLGNGIFTVAFPLEVLRITNSPLVLAVAVGARTLPAVLLMLVGGTIVDRVPRRLVMLASDVACGVLVGGAAVLIEAGQSRVWELATLSALFGVAAAFFRPASSAIVPDILPEGLLVSASSLTMLSQSLAQYLLGPAVGGIIVAVTGVDWAFGLDAISFAISAGCLLAMRVSISPSGTRSGLIDGIVEGLRYCRSRQWLWWGIIASGICNIACYIPSVILEPVLVKQVFHSGGVALGLMFAASGAGGALASVWAGRRHPARRVRACWFGWAGGGVATAGMALSPWLWLAIVLAGAAWFGATYGSVVWLPLMQAEVPPDMLGRAIAVDWTASLALAPLGTVAAGLIATVAGVRVTLLIGGLICAAAGSVLMVPGVTEPDRR
jgi:predicted MFS family arabinose efflux permease